MASSVKIRHVVLLPYSILVANHKGGVGKTSLVANLSANAASIGWHVLAVDLDALGTLARDLGYLDRSDGGADLLDAFMTGRAPNPITEVRDRLDVIAGGPRIAELSEQIATLALHGEKTAIARLGSCLAQLAGDYDLVVVDVPPGDRLIERAAASFARWVLCPTLPEGSSLEGIARVGETIAEVDNDELELLGVVVSFAPPAGGGTIERIRSALSQRLGGPVPMFESTLRAAPLVAAACREHGLTAAEYRELPSPLPPWYEDRVSFEALSASGAELAEDYLHLTEELVVAITDLQQAEAATTAVPEQLVPIEPAAVAPADHLGPTVIPRSGPGAPGPDPAAGAPATPAARSRSREWSRPSTHTGTGLQAFGPHGGIVPPVPSPPGSSPRKAESLAKGRQGRIPGIRRGNRRMLDVWLGEQSRKVIDQDPASRTRGEVLVAAVEFASEALALQFGPRARNPGAAPSPGSRRTRTVDRARRSVTISVSEQDAEMISAQVARTSLSLGAYCEQALMLYAETRRS